MPDALEDKNIGKRKTTTEKVNQVLYSIQRIENLNIHHYVAAVAKQANHESIFFARVNVLLRYFPYDQKEKIIIKTGSTMPEWANELTERIKRFTEETGLTEEQLIKAADNRPPHDELFVDMASEKGLTPDEYREELLQSNMKVLVTDETIKTVKRLQKEVEFSADEIAIVIEKSYDEGTEILEVMAQDKNIRDFKLLTNVAGVATNDIVDLYRDKNPEDRYGVTEYGPLDDMLDEHFPDKDWSRHEDVDTSALDFDDRVIKDIMGEPKSRGFTEQLMERDFENGSDKDKQR